jgi:hypothetical protein
MLWASMGQAGMESAPNTLLQDLDSFQPIELNGFWGAD